jgi:hypothetical protein
MTTTTTRRLAAWRRGRGFLGVEDMGAITISPAAALAQDAMATLADFDGSLSQIDRRHVDTIRDMEPRRRVRVAALLIVLASSTRAGGQGRPGSALPAVDAPYARIAILRPHDGDTVDFEAGYIRHLAWHQQAGDTWAWYGWTITFGERQRSFVYASFGHSAASLDAPVSPADDERDNVLNVVPHAQFLGNALYEFLPALSRGAGAPTATARLEFTTVDVAVGAERAFEAAVRGAQAALQNETLWYRMIAGGGGPRYVRLRPRPTLASMLIDAGDRSLPDQVNTLIVKTTIEILTLRPAMSLGIAQTRD